MKLAIIGSRTFNDYDLLCEKLNRINSINKITLIVSGGANGADKLGEKYANENNILTKIFLPDWEKFGKKAGYLRNINIINEAECIIAFWDGVSKGTEHSINLAKENKKKCLIVNF
jgi:hypothetical protein